MVKMSEEEYLKVTTVSSTSATNFSNSKTANPRVYKHTIISYVYSVVPQQVNGKDV